MTRDWDAHGTVPVEDTERTRRGGENAEEQRKRQALDCLEAERGRSRPSETAVETIPAGDNVIFLQDELRRARAACALMEKDIHRLEQKALEAIAESGHLRRKLLEMEAERPAGCASELVRQRQEMEVALHEGEVERSLLTGALTQSEQEIARLVKCADALIKRMNEH